MWWAEGNGESEQRRDQKGKKLGEGKMEEKRLAEEKERMGRRDWWRRRWRGGRGSETRGREDGEEGGVKETGREDGEGKVVKKEEKTSEYGGGWRTKEHHLQDQGSVWVGDQVMWSESRGLDERGPCLEGKKGLNIRNL